MNFYDEAIDAKNSLQLDLVDKQRNLNQLVRTKAIEEIETRNICLRTLYNHDIAALENADPYFWEPRITQLVLATGQQLPETVKYDASWLRGKAGYWWFGRSSPLIGVSDDNERRYVNALLWSLNPNGSVSIQTFYIDGRTQQSLGSLNWAEGESLCDAMQSLGETRTTVAYVPDVTLRQIALELSERIVQLDKQVIGITKEVIQKQQEINELREQREAQPYDLNKYQSQLLTEEERSQVDREKTEQFGEEYKRRLDEWLAASKNALMTFACGCLWLQQKIITVSQAPLSRAAERRLARADIDPKCLVVELRSKQYTRTTPDDETKHVDWAWQWAVRGHWRDQPTKDGYKLIWIHPFIKGPEDKPLKPSAARVFAVRR